MELEEYNNGSSWLISSMSQEELEKAFKGWSMGNECLENLLRTCHNIGLETGGCHVGRVSYLQFYKNDSQKDIIKILNAVQPIKGTAFFVCPDGGNPFSGPSWHRPTMSVDMYTKEPAIADSFFNTITDSILSNDIQPVPGVYSQLLTLHEFEFAFMVTLYLFTVLPNCASIVQFHVNVLPQLLFHPLN